MATPEKITKTFIVLGMHGSATSLVAGSLHKFGVNMGKELLGGGNSKTSPHYEDISFLKLNEKILMAAGGFWDNPPPEKKPIYRKLENKNYVSKNNSLTSIEEENI